MSVTNEWGQIEEAAVAKLEADLSGVFRTILSVTEAEADDFPKSFPAVLFSFAGARVVNKTAINAAPTFGSLAEGRYAALTYATSGKSEEKARFGDLGIYELEKLVRSSLMGKTPVPDFPMGILFWRATDPPIQLPSKGGSGVLKMRTEFSLDQMVTATVT